MCIKNSIGHLFKTTAFYFNLISTKLLIDKTKPDYIAAQRVVKWFNDDGDKTHRLNYDLDSESLVFDLGGYEGQWSSDMYSMYRCKILIFEPYLPFALNIEKRFKKNPEIELLKFGLGSKNEKVGFSVLENGSSMFRNGNHKDSIELIAVTEFITLRNINSVDLIKINIEGGEYELLESLIDNGLIKIFKNIQVQFHDFIINDAEFRMKEIQKKLSETHYQTYHYHFIWENWTLKNQ